MKPQDRRAAINAYKEQKTAAGVFAIHCQTGEGGQTGALVWVGKAPNLDTIENRYWFSLRLGTHPNAGLQAAWTAHGEAAFSIEILEQLDDDISDIARPRVLKERAAHWCATLGAQGL